MSTGVNMGVKLQRHLLNSKRPRAPSVNEMAPHATIGIVAEENSLRISWVKGGKMLVKFQAKTDSNY